MLGTSSSEAALPLMLDKMERYGCKRSIVGSSFQPDTRSTSTNVDLSLDVRALRLRHSTSTLPTQQLSVLGVLMLTSKGAAGVTGRASSCWQVRWGRCTLYPSRAWRYYSASTAS